MSWWVSSLGFLAAALGVVVAVPQWARLRKVRTSDGVSTPTWALAASAGIMWTSYSVALGSAPLIVGNGLALAGSLALLVALARCKVPMRGSLALLAGTAAVTAALLALSPTALGWAATCASVTMRVPQLHRTITGGKGVGLSTGTWLVSAASAGAWVAYGALIGSWPVVVTDGWALAAAVGVLMAARRQ